MISKLANFIHLSESWNGKIVFEVSSKLLSKAHFFCPSTSERFSSKQFVLKIETETQHFGSLTPGRNGVKSEYQYQTLSINLTWVIYHTKNKCRFLRTLQTFWVLAEIVSQLSFLVCSFHFLKIVWKSNEMILFLCSAFYGKSNPFRAFKWYFSLALSGQNNAISFGSIPVLAADLVTIVMRWRPEMR